MPNIRPQELLVLIVILLMFTVITAVAVWTGVLLAGRSGRSQASGGRCPNCGSAMPPDARYCSSCGSHRQVGSGA
jgi:hypothetical protein